MYCSTINGNLLLRFPATTSAMFSIAVMCKHISMSIVPVLYFYIIILYFYIMHNKHVRYVIHIILYYLELVK